MFGLFDFLDDDTVFSRLVIVAIVLLLVAELCKKCFRTYKLFR
jgi:hypothetical protein